MRNMKCAFRGSVLVRQPPSIATDVDRNNAAYSFFALTMKRDETLAFQSASAINKGSRYVGKKSGHNYVF